MSLTLTLRRSPLPDVDDCRSTLLWRFSELGIATTTTAAAANGGGDRSVPQIRIQIHTGTVRIADDENGSTTTVTGGRRTRALNRTAPAPAAEVYSTVRR